MRRPHDHTRRNQYVQGLVDFFDAPAWGQVRVFDLASDFTWQTPVDLLEDGSPITAAAVFGKIILVGVHDALLRLTPGGCILWLVNE